MLSSKGDRSVLDHMGMVGLVADRVVEADNLDRLHMEGIGEPHRMEDMEAYKVLHTVEVDSKEVVQADRRQELHRKLLHDRMKVVGSRKDMEHGERTLDYMEVG